MIVLLYCIYLLFSIRQRFYEGLTMMGMYSYLIQKRAENTGME